MGTIRVEVENERIRENLDQPQASAVNSGKSATISKAENISKDRNFFSIFLKLEKLVQEIKTILGEDLAGIGDNFMKRINDPTISVLRNVDGITPQVTSLRLIFRTRRAKKRLGRIGMRIRKNKQLMIKKVRQNRSNGEANQQLIKKLRPKGSNRKA